MLIDWFTVVAQIVNFLVLVALLKHFFWARLVTAIDSREKRIAGRLHEADEKKGQADLAVDHAHMVRAEAERERAELLARAVREGEDLRMRTIRETRESVQALERKWLDELEREKVAYASEVRKRTVGQILAVIRRALADLACTDLENCTVRVFLEKLGALDAATLAEITAGGELKVVTAMDLSEEERTAIRSAVGAATLEFARDPEMAWGIELRAGGRKIGWNVDSYLESLERNLSEALTHPAASALETVS